MNNQPNNPDGPKKLNPVQLAALDQHFAQMIDLYLPNVRRIYDGLISSDFSERDALNLSKEAVREITRLVLGKD